MKTPLSITHPELAAEWHPTKNSDLLPDKVPAGSSKEVWWQCSKGLDHEWQATVVKRTTERQGCPFCAGRKASVTNSLASRFPEVAAEWHPTKNEDLTPNKVVAGSNKSFWWRCAMASDHEWQAKVTDRIRGNGCPACSGRIATPATCLRALHPQLADQWHPERNGALTPDNVRPGSNEKVWWQCPKGGDHVWQAMVCNRTRGRNCPFCAGKKVSITNALASLFPEVASQWHPTKNGAILPDQVVAGSNQQFWWHCPEGPDHEWQAQPCDRTKKNPTGCPFCSGQVVSITNSLTSLFPAVAAQWHPTKNGELTPDKILAGTHKSFWWQCPDCPDHEWQAPVVNRTRAATGCPSCCGLKVAISNSLASLFPDIAAQWHPTKNGNLTPEQVVAGSNKQAWWKCLDGPDHEWQAPPSNRTYSNQFSCPFCIGKRVSVTNSLAAGYPELAA